MHTPHRHRRRLAVGVALSALLLAGLPVAGPASPSLAAPPDPATPGQNLRTDLDPGTYQVTLITGDRARLNVSADRHVAVDITPAPRADGSTPEVEWYTSGDGVYVLPADARPHLDAGLLDWRLFDVEHLALQGFTDDAVDGLPLIVEYGGDRGPATANCVTTTTIPRRVSTLRPYVLLAALESLLHGAPPALRQSGRLAARVPVLATADDPTASLQRLGEIVSCDNYVSTAGRLPLANHHSILDQVDRRYLRARKYRPRRGGSDDTQLRGKALAC